MHSTTKYLNGHCDCLGGALMLSDTNLYEKLKFNQNAMGAILSPFDSYLLLRGIKTLAVRMDRHQENAYKVATYLLKHKKIKNVYFPGLESHPQYALAKKQTRGASGTFSFELAGDVQAVKIFLSNLHHISLAESLGGVESLIEHPALMTHASIPQEEREKIGISDSLVRISVGIEHVDDIIGDLDAALEK
jgi:cystathionine gamma-lyase